MSKYWLVEERYPSGFKETIFGSNQSAARRKFREIQSGLREGHSVYGPWFGDICSEPPELVHRAFENGGSVAIAATKAAAVPVRFRSSSPLGTKEASLEINGVDLSRVTHGIKIESVVGEMAKVEMSVLALDGFDVTLPAAVTVQLLPLEEGTLDVTTLGDGTTRYHFTRKEPIA